MEFHTKNAPVVLGNCQIQLNKIYNKLAWSKAEIKFYYYFGASQQILYLIDEDENPRKDADCVKSLIHHYFETHTKGERAAYLVKTKTMR